MLSFLTCSVGEIGGYVGMIIGVSLMDLEAVLVKLLALLHEKKLIK